ncbi:type II secretion system protein [bacterium]|nr:type II secretion system protein [bacterium]
MKQKKETHAQSHCERSVAIAKLSNRTDDAITTQTSFARNDKRIAFTLAEVLITLAIIGVVAAMTIPTLISNYQDKAFATAATTFERKLGEALKVMNVSQTLAGHRTTESFIAELSKHFKIVKTCSNDKLMDCFVDEVVWGSNSDVIDMSQIKTAKNLGQEEWGTDVIGVQFANGTNGLVAYNPTDSCKQDPFSNGVNVTGCLAILYDTNAFKSPNKSARDLRSINVKSLAGSSCMVEIDGTCFGPLFTPTPISYSECESLKSELGISNCCAECDNYDGDFWAGAIKACGGVQNMPKPSDIAKLAGKLYPGATYHQEGEFDAYGCPDGTNCFDVELANSYGMLIDPTLGFTGIWFGESQTQSTGEPMLVYGAFAPDQYLYNADWDGSFRYTGAYGFPKAMCIE